LLGLATSDGLIVSLQEGALRAGPAAASDPLDFIIAAPGSQTDAFLATIFLQPLLYKHNYSFTLLFLQDTRVHFSENASAFATG